ncbi:hypothetical protein C8R45DRAFT_966884 [Mycena sanguinolenta]|nr:hypothetical protein C8R45DRAFT_966884 [Mycena sanguinolenta]
MHQSYHARNVHSGPLVLPDFNSPSCQTRSLIFALPHRTRFPSNASNAGQIPAAQISSPMRRHGVHHPPLLATRPTFQPESQKSTTQKVGDTISFNSNHNDESLLTKAKNAVGMGEKK